MKPAISLPRDRSTIDYESEDEKQDSDHQLTWSRVMEEGRYKNSSTYRKAEVLLLCWKDSCSDLTTENEIRSLKAVFEGFFNYHVEIKYLDTTIEPKIQVRVNAIVANFVGEHDGPNTLLIVYYAGHGKQGRESGTLELVGQTSPNDTQQTSPNDTQKRLDSLVWAYTECLLSPAEADVLEIFDCCHAGLIDRTKGQRSFEYLAATEASGLTKVPGPDSFTSALIHALKSLVEEREDGRFTTVQLLKRIETAPDFPKEQQHPRLFNRDKKFSTGHIILYPLQRAGSDDIPRKDAGSLDAVFKKKTLTLHFDFDEKPSQDYIEIFGRGLNELFQHNPGVNQVRWGGIKRSMVAIAAKTFRQAGRERNRREGTIMSNTDNSENTLPLTPSSLNEHSPRITEPVATSEPDSSPADISAMLLPRPMDSNDKDEGQTQGLKGRRKRRRAATSGKTLVPLTPTSSDQ